MSDVLGTTDWATKIREMYEEGAADAEVAAELRITLKDFYAQYEKNAGFAGLIDFGRTLSQAWWEKQARKNVGNKSFNTQLWAFYMKNKHAWADRVDTTSHNENLNTNLDELKQRVVKELESFVKQNGPELTDAKRVLSEVGKVINEQA